MYNQHLAGIPGIGFQPVASWAQPAPWLYCITVNQEAFGKSRDEVIAALAAEEIESRPFFLSLHRLPPFREASTRRGEVLPVTDNLSESGLNLPTFAGLTDAHIAKIADVIRSLRT